MGENVAYGLREQFWNTMSEHDILARVEHSLHLVGMPGIESMQPSDLSGGMKKRVGLARTLALQPEVILYDEPTSGLDPPTSRMVDDLIDGMRQRFGVTSIVISHDIASCFRIAHQAVLLIKGQIVARGTPDALVDGGSEEAKKFIEMSGVDIKHVTRVGKADHSGKPKERGPVGDAAVTFEG